MQPQRLVFCFGNPVADQPLEVLEVVLIGCRDIGGVTAEYHDPFAVALGVDDRVTRGSVGDAAR